MTSTPSVSGRSEATHQFLKLVMPLDHSLMPQPRILHAGQTHTFPFTFVVPQQLLPRACSHKVDSDHVHQTHLQLPPSLGDPELAGFNGLLLDDFAPEMSRITYGIKVKVSQFREADSTVYIISDKMKKIRVKPAFEVQPPINVDSKDREYRLRQEKVIRKGLFKGKLGTLVMQSAQPKSLVIPGARSPPTTLTTMAKVVLRFDPADENSQPPRFGSLNSKIKVSTFFASYPRTNFPNRTSHEFDSMSGIYSETLDISKMCVASAQWERHESEASLANARRDSGVSDCSTQGRSSSTSLGVAHTNTSTHSTAAATKNYKGKSFYTATLLVPITLPENKNFVPTFHSCLISRAYLLNLHLSVHAPGIGDPTLSVKVPIQIAADSSESGAVRLREAQTETQDIRDADDMWRPRNVAPPQTDGQSSLTVGQDAPPDYAVFAASNLLPVRVVS
jgi:hypothetical protein